MFVDRHVAGSASMLSSPRTSTSPATINRRIADRRKKGSAMVGHRARTGIPFRPVALRRIRNDHTFGWTNRRVTIGAVDRAPRTTVHRTGTVSPESRSPDRRRSP